MIRMKLIVNDSFNERLDKYIFECEEIDISRSKIQNLIKTGNVLVNGKEAKNSYIVCDGDEIDINIVLESSIYKCDIKNKMISKYIDCSKIILNRDINVIGCESSSDAVYFYEKNIPTIIMNPVGGYPHGNGEFVNKKSLEDLYEIYSLFLKEVEIYD